MTTKHKHIDLIIAWANGATIQFKNRHGVWADVPTPSWNSNYEYRLKPEQVPDKVFYDMTRKGISLSREYVTEMVKRFPQDYVCATKTTIKTDENGVETKHVEII